MFVFESQKLIFAHLNTAKKEGKTIGFVPTMGALHKGHLSLIQNAAENNDLVVVSIFVNPTQFNNPEDLQKYPRTLIDDLEKIRSIQPDCVVFTPSIDEIYEGNTTTESFDFGIIAQQMEGKFRPGHFDGVGTIVKKLFQITQPNNAYFGEKDFQQLQIIKKLVDLENIPVKIIPCAIYREENGLAMSSRNERLSPKHREEAKFIYALLQEVQSLFKSQSLAEINSFVKNKISKHPDFKLEYFEIASEETLETMSLKKESQNYRAFIAVYANKIRLIDNISLK